MIVECRIGRNNEPALILYVKLISTNTNIMLKLNIKFKLNILYVEKFP